MKMFIDRIKKNPDKSLYYFMILLVVATMIPVWYLSRYAVPSLDDYGFGAGPHRGWVETHSIVNMLRAAAEYVHFYFFAKQATYSSIFLMTLFPGVTNERLYILTPFIMTGMVIGSLSALVHVICKDCMGVKNKYATETIKLIMVFISIQTMIAPLEGIYWFNGALHYVFMQSVLYFEAALVLHYIHSEKLISRILCLVGASVLGIIVGGANLITGLQACILIFILVLVWIVQIIGSKKSGKIIEFLGLGEFDKKNILLLIPLIITVIGFLTNATAPGNSLRAEVEVQMNPIKAVIMSFYWAIIYIVNWTTPIVMAAFAMIAALVWKLTENTKKRYINPIISLVISYGVFAAMLTPTFYATSADAPNRVKNIIGIALYVLYFVNLVNGLGYIRRYTQIDPFGKKTGRFIAVGLIAMVIIFMFPKDKNMYTSISAVRSIVNGEAARYYNESLERIALYNDESKPDIEIHKYSEDARPYLLFKQDVSNDGDEGYWQIIQICEYYNKNSITVVEQ